MVAIRVVKQDRESWLTRHLPGPESEPPASPNAALIEARMQLTQETGKHALWEGYARVPGYAKSTRRPRSSNQVRTTAVTGAFYSWLVAAFGARQVVEFGTAFGVSGMHWLTGLAATGGHLFTYEPNAVWRALALDNLAAISPAFTSVEGTFEENAAATLQPGCVDIGFIDAIHTSAFVDSQFAILRRYVRPGGLVLFDDIHFSEDMKACWQRIAQAAEVRASAGFGGRVGIVELR